MPVQVCVDDSGGVGQGKTFALAGFIAKAEAWVSFSSEWKECLHEDPAIPRFKMSEAARLRGAFSRFTSVERDDKLRALARIINRHADRAIYCIEDLDAFAETIGKEDMSAPLINPYFWPYQIVILAVCHSLLERDHSEPFEIIFDKQEVLGPRVSWWYPLIREHMDAECRAIAPAEPVFRSDDEFAPLQAADLLAWLVRRAANDNATPFDWLVEEFSDVPMSPDAQVLDRERMEGIVRESHRLTPLASAAAIARNNELLGRNKEADATRPWWQTRDLRSRQRKSP